LKLTMKKLKAFKMSWVGEVFWVCWKVAQDELVMVWEEKKKDRDEDEDIFGPRSVPSICEVKNWSWRFL
jgi:hypothetical protein